MGRGVVVEPPGLHRRARAAARRSAAACEADRREQELRDATASPGGQVLPVFLVACIVASAVAAAVQRVDGILATPWVGNPTAVSVGIVAPLVVYTLIGLFLMSRYASADTREDACLLAAVLLIVPLFAFPATMMLASLLLRTEHFLDLDV